MVLSSCHSAVERWNPFNRIAYPWVLGSPAGGEALLYPNASHLSCDGVVSKTLSINRYQSITSVAAET